MAASTAQTKHKALAMVAVVASLLMLYLPASVAQGVQNVVYKEIPDNRGREFIIGFMQQYTRDLDGAIRLFITSDYHTKVQIVIPDVYYQVSVTVNPRELYSVDVSNSLRMRGTGKERKGIYIKAENEVVVYGLNIKKFTTDAFLALPIDIQSTNYVIPSFTASQHSLIGIIGIHDDTTIFVTFRFVDKKSVFSFRGRSYRHRDTFRFKLNRLETFQIEHDSDMTGTRVVSTHPISVFSGNECANVPFGIYFCDHLVEHIPPTNTWGTRFITAPLRGRSRGDLFRILAANDSTTIDINGRRQATLDEGRFLEIDVPSNQYQYVETSKPCLVIQYSKGSRIDNTKTDPFMIMIPPIEQYTAQYTVSTPDQSSQYFTSYINIIIETEKIDHLRLDGRSLREEKWVPVWGTSHSAAQIAVSHGVHRVMHDSPIVPFAIFLYGFSKFDSYGYPGGLRLADLTLECVVGNPGDGLDNDCDRRIDEELKNFIDDDGDGRIDEDLVTEPPRIQLAVLTSVLRGCPSEVKKGLQEPTVITAPLCNARGRFKMSHNDDVVESNCVQYITRTWYVRDGCGNLANTSQSITIGRPNFHVIFPADVHEKCHVGDDLQVTGKPVVTTNCSDDVVSIRYQDSPSLDKCIRKGATVNREWTVKASCGSSTKHVQKLHPDNTPPTAQFVGEKRNTVRHNFNIKWRADEESKFECALDNPSDRFECGQGKAGSFNRKNIKNGPHSFYVRPIDLAGNVGQFIRHRFTADNVGPSLRFIRPLESQVKDLIRIRWLSPEKARFKCGLHAARMEWCGSGKRGVKQYTNLKDGIYTFHVGAHDKYRNEAKIIRHTFRVDRTAPNIELKQPVPPLLTTKRAATFKWTSDETAYFKCAIDKKAPVACGRGTSGEWSTPSLPNGKHVFKLYAKDDLGNEAEPVVHQWSIDTTAPILNFIGELPETESSNSQIFRWASSEIATFLCSVDSVTDFKPCEDSNATPRSARYRNGKWTSTNLDDGPHTFRVKAIDAIGNEGNTLKHTWTIDTTPPQVVLDDVPPKISKPIMNFTWDASEPSTFRCLVDGVSHDCGQGSDGSFSTPVLDDGLHTLKLEAKDLVGNKATPQIVKFTTDTSVPTLRFLGRLPRIGKKKREIFRWRSSEPATFLCSLDSATEYRRCKANFSSSGRWFSPTLSDGPHTFRVKGVDRNGNEGPVLAHHWKTDTQPPTVTLNDVPSITTDPKVNFLWDSSEPSKFKCLLNGKAYECGNGTLGAFTTPDLPDGKHMFTLAVKDLVGNEAPIIRSPFVKDTKGPVISFNRQNPTKPESDVRVSWRSSEDAEFECSLDDPNRFKVCGSGRDGAFEAEDLPDGEHKLYVRGRDKVDNVGEPSVFTVNTDTTVPTIQFTDNKKPLSRNSTDTFTWTASEDSNFMCQVDNKPERRCGRGTNGSFTTPFFTSGQHVLRVHAIDKVGNKGPVAERVYTVDTTAPSVHYYNQPPRESGDEVTFKWHSSENASFECALDYVTNAQPCGNGADGVKQLTSLSKGKHVFWVRGTDEAGNVGQYVPYDWTVDTSAPSIRFTGNLPAQTKNSIKLLWTSDEDSKFECALVVHSSGNRNINYEPCGSGTSGQWKHNALPESKLTFYVRARDKLDNLGKPIAHTWVVDTTPPRAVLDPVPEVTSNPRMTLSWRANEEATFLCAIGDVGNLIDCGHGKNGGFSTPRLRPGPQQFWLIAQDHVGNRAEPVPARWHVDSSAPKVTFDPDSTRKTKDNPTFSWTSDEDASFLCAIDGLTRFEECGQGKSGTWTASDVPDGKHKFLVRAHDDLGNESPRPHAFHFEKDSTPPTGFTVESPPRLTNKPEAKFKWKTTEDSRYDCYLDNQTDPVFCGSGRDGDSITPALPDGEHDFKVVATDSTGNKAPVVNHKWFVDTTGPKIRLDGDLPHETTSNSPRFKWSADEPAQFKCSVDDMNTWRQCGDDLRPTGVWEGDDIDDGPHTLYVKGIDQLGNPGQPVSHRFKVDSNGPVVTFNPDQPRSTLKSPRFQWTSSEPATFECSLDDLKSWRACGGGPQQNNGVWQGINLDDGKHTLYVQGVDDLGNKGQPARHRFTVDNKAPELEIIIKPKLNASNPTFAWRSSEDVTFDCSLDGAPYTSCGQGREGSWTGDNVPDGRHAFTVQGKDANGNTIRHTHTWPLDATLPRVTLRDPQSVSRQPIQNFAWDSSESAIFTCRVDILNQPGSDEKCGSGSFGRYVTDRLPDGDHTFYVTPKDPSGNTGPTVKHTWRSDASRPVITFPPDLPRVTKQNPEFTWTSSEPASFKCSIIGSTYTQVDCGSGLNGSWTPRGLTDGPHSFLVYGVDDMGNRGQDKHHRFTVDSNSPAISFPVLPRVSEPRIQIPWQSTEQAYFECSLDDGAYKPCGASDPSQQGIKQLTNLDHGPHKFSVRGRDRNGNVGEPSTHTWNVDTKPPKVIIEEPFPNKTSQPSILVRWTSDEEANFFCAVDNPEQRVWCGYGKRGVWRTFRVPRDGDHMVYIFAVDPRNNTGFPARRQWSLDTIPPSVKISKDPSTGKSDKPRFTWRSSEDASYECAIDNTRLYQDCGKGTSGSFTASDVPDGSHAFFLRATDDVGNHGNHQQFQFSVDTEGPSVRFINSPPPKTRQPQATFEWQSSEPSNFECMLDGKKVQCGPNVRQYGKFVTPILPEGKHTFSLNTIDHAGNKGKPAVIDWSVDATPPAVKINVDQNTFNTSNPTFKWTSSEDATFECAVDNSQLYEFCGNGTSGQFTATNVPSGRHVFLVRAKDDFNNYGDHTQFPFKVDTVAPRVYMQNTPPKKTNKPSVTFAWSASEDAKFECVLDGKPVDCGHGFQGRYKTPDLPDGTHSFVLSMVDNSGNRGEPKKVDWEIDTSGPDVIFDPNTPRKTKGDLSVKWSSSEPVAYFECAFNGLSNSGRCGNTRNNGKYNLYNLPTGTHTFYVRAVDDSKNVGDWKPFEFVVDRSGPEINFPEDNPKVTDSNPSFKWTSSEQAKYKCALDSTFNLVDCGEGTSGKWNGQDVPDGQHVFMVYGVDEFGNHGKPIQHRFTVDNTAPKIAFSQIPDKTSSSPRFTWTSSEDAKFECSLDDGDFELCSTGRNGAWTGSNLPDGRHKFSVRGIDDNGNVGEPVKFNWDVDSTAPVIVFPSDLPTMTKANPLVTWTSAEPANYECALDDVNNRIKCGGGRSGRWYGVNIPKGLHTFFVRGTDQMNNVGDWTPYKFTADTSGPKITLPTNTPSVTKQNPSFEWKSSEPAKFMCGIDNTFTMVDCGEGTRGRWTTPYLYDGPHIFIVRGVDELENPGEYTKHPFTVDTSAPDIIFSNAQPVTNSTPHFSWTSTDDAQAFECSLDDASYVHCGSGRNGDWSKDNLPNGRHVLSVRARDENDNIGEPKQHIWNVDAVPPKVQLGPVPKRTNNPYTQITGTSDKNAIFKCSVDDQTPEPCGRGKWFQWVTPDLPDGNHTFKLTYKDLHGNKGPTLARSWTVDTKAPVVTLDAALPIKSGKNSTIRWTSDEDAKFECFLDKLDKAIDCGSGKQGSWTGSDLPDGRHLFWVRGKDPDGNVGRPDVHGWVVDAKAPVVTFDAGIPTTSGKNPTIRWTSDEDAEFECFLDDNDEAIDCGNGRRGSWTGTDLSNGRHHLWVRGKDPSGNIGQRIIHGWVVDETAPRLMFTGAPPASSRRMPIFRWKSNEPATFECSLNDEKFWFCGRNITGQWTRAEVDSGLHTFRVRGRDALGNLGEPISHDILIDNTAPVMKLREPLPRRSKEPVVTFTYTSDEHTTFKCAIDNLKNQQPCGKGVNGLFKTDALRDGRHTFYLLGEDDFGNKARVLTHKWIVDSTNPEVAFLPDQPDHSGSDVTLRWKTIGNSPATFKCALDDQRKMEPCGNGWSGSWSGNDIPDGSHTFYVQPQDQFGDPGDTIRHRWIVDTTVPNVKLIGTPPKVSSDEMGSFFWVSDEEASYECAVDVVERSVDCGKGTDGRWDSPDLDDGKHTFYLFSTDKNENKGEPVSFTWTIDSTPPVVTMDETNPPISGHNITIKWKSSEKATYKCALDSIFDTRDCGSGTHGQTVLTDLADGSHALLVQAVDDLGNTAEWKRHDWVVDNEPPKLIFTSELPVDTAGTAVFHWRTSEPSTFKCKLDSDPKPSPCGKGLSSNYTATDLKHGRRRFSVTATDIFGNERTIQHSWNADRKPPVLRFRGSLPKVTGKKINLAWVSTEFTHFTCAHEDAMDMKPCGNATTGRQIERDLPEGKHRFWVGGTDKVGNKAVVLSHDWITDTRGPTLYFNEPVPRKSGRTVRFSWRSNEYARFYCAFDTPSKFVFCGEGFESHVQSNNLKRDGEHRIFIKGVDKYGNSGDSISTKWTVDLIAPVLIDVSPLPRLTNQNPIITWHVNEEAVFECALDDLNKFEWCGNGTEGQFRGRNLAKGPHRLVVRVKDPQGNSKPIINHTFVVGIPDNRGLEFILAFMQQYNQKPDGSVSLFITSDNATKCTIEIPGLTYRSVIQLQADELIRVDLPILARLSNTARERKGILVTADHELVVYGLNIMPHSTDAFLALPTDIQGTEYYAVSYYVSQNSLIAVVGIEDSTTIYITLKMSEEMPLVYKGVVYRDGDTIIEEINRLDTFQIAHKTDLTGSRITATKVISVYSGNECANVPKDKGYCDHLVEMLTPTSTWGRRFVTAPLHSRTGGDFFRVVASKDNTEVVFHPGNKLRINAGEFVERDVASDEYQFITASNPCILMQYSKGADVDQTDTDPFMIMIPPIEQYGSHYILSTPDRVSQYFQSYVNIIVLSKHQRGVLVDGQPVYLKHQFKEIKGTPYSASAVAVSKGVHRVDHTSPIVTFGAFMYGYTWRDSYGYPGGLRLADITADTCTGVDTPADGMDNDCDRRIDEELMNGIDDDGDGRIDEDLATFPPDIQLSQTYYEYESCTLEVDALVPRAKAIGSYECELKGHIRLTYQDIYTELECARLINRTWRAADGCGNVVKLVQVIKIIKPKLEITYPRHVPNGCNGPIDLKETGEPIIESLCKREQVVVAYRDNISVNECQKKGLLLERTFTITEKCGREYTGEQRIFPGAVQ